jgi:hypothetical protein
MEKYQWVSEDFGFEFWGFFEIFFRIFFSGCPGVLQGSSVGVPGFFSGCPGVLQWVSRGSFVGVPGFLFTNRGFLIYK